MTEETKGEINKEFGPKEGIIIMKEQEHEVLNSVPAIHRKSLQKLIHSSEMYFLKN